MSRDTRHVPQVVVIRGPDDSRVELGSKQATKLLETIRGIERAGALVVVPTSKGRVWGVIEWRTPVGVERVFVFDEPMWIKRGEVYRKIDEADFEQIRSFWEGHQNQTNG